MIITPHPGNWTLWREIVQVLISGQSVRGRPRSTFSQRKGKGRGGKGKENVKGKMERGQGEGKGRIRCPGAPSPRGSLGPAAAGRCCPLLAVGGHRGDTAGTSRGPGPPRDERGTEHTWRTPCTHLAHLSYTLHTCRIPRRGFTSAAHG